mmetsp:Transcript_29263/g.28390  ORF Transcript_29263/g.28390 Transcript_29263/m.28390 type:complete len:122 (-) Transcript_29263:2220-2585(-)
MTAGTNYYLEVTHYQGWGSEHVSLAVEIKKDSGTHFNQKKEIQRLQINPVNDREKTVFIFESAAPFDGGAFDIYFYKTLSNDDKFGPYTVTNNADASTFRDSIKGYFTSELGASISVELEM